jgi:hypothetical protein
MIAVVTGGRTHWPTLAEFETLDAECRRRGVTVVRDGDARGVDRTVRGYVRSRQLADVDIWPADWTTHKRAAGAIRNRAMLDGDPPDLLGTRKREPASLLFAFKGGRGTADCRKAAADRGIEVVDIAPRREPRIWNMHHAWKGDHPQPPGLLYVGRSTHHGGPSPLANPYRVESGDRGDPTAIARILVSYRRWLWERIQADDALVLAALRSITPDTWLGCTCWPMPCHAEVIVRWWRKFGTRGESLTGDSPEPRTAPTS